MLMHSYDIRRFDADADAAEENRSFEEANETEETSLLEANSTNTLPPISTGVGFYCCVQSGLRDIIIE